MKKLVLLTLLLAIVLIVLWPTSIVGAADVVIVGGWGAKAEELGLLHEQIPGSVVIVPRRYLPLGAAAAALYEQLRANGSAVFIAHSWGGLIVRQLAEDHPELVKAMVLIGTPSGGYWFAPQGLFHVAVEKSAHIPVFVIAGNKGVSKWYIPGPNDGTVEVSSVLSVKAQEYRVLSLGHVDLTQSAEVLTQIQLWIK